MIKLTYENLNDINLTGGVDKLAKAGGLPTKVAYSAAKINEKMKQEAVKAREAFVAIFAKHGVEFKPGAEIPADKQEAMDSDIKAFMATGFELDYARIPLSQVEKAGLSGVELLALEPILLHLEVLPGGAS